MNTQNYLSNILRSCEVESLQRRANELEKRLIPHMEAEVKLRNDFGLSVLPDTYILMSLRKEYQYCISRINELNNLQGSIPTLPADGQMADYSRHRTSEHKPSDPNAQKEEQ